MHISDLNVRMSLHAHPPHSNIEDIFVRYISDYTNVWRITSQTEGRE